MNINDDNFDLLFVKPEKEIKQNEQIETCKIHPFKDHPYKVKDDEMQELINSIKEHGIIEPLKLLKDDNFYEVISGHRRLHAAMKLGLQTLPATVYEISRDEAAILLVDSNLHREHILPSEKAFAYKMKMDALSHKGKRTDLTSSQVATKLDSANEIGKTAGESRDTVYRYIRLTNLIPELLNKMDEGKIALTVGEALSYLDADMQKSVLNQCELNECTPSYAQSVEMKKAFQNGTLTQRCVSEIMCREKANQRETIKINANRLKNMIPRSLDQKQTEDYVVKAVEYYTRYLQKKREYTR